LRRESDSELMQKCQNIDVSGAAVRYARNGGVHLAYRVLGDGELPLVIVPGYVSNVDLWDDPARPFASVVEQLARQTRLILWDKRGTGLSDPVTRVPTLDERMDDLHAVLDAAEVDRPALLGISEGGPMSILFAATFPDRVQSMVLYGTAARFTMELPDFPWGWTPEFVGKIHYLHENHWGEGRSAKALFGEAADTPGVREMLGRFERASASPAMAAMLIEAAAEIDVRNILGTIGTTTLVLSRPGDQLVPIEASEALATAMPNAQFRALPPGAHAAFDIDDSLATETLNFVCGPMNRPTSERVLATVLFTDIVGSTEQLSKQGDSRWRHQLDVHDQMVDRSLSRYGGRRAKHTGDGVFALFDGPTKAVRCGLELVPTLATRGISIRVGIHTGECEKRGDEWSGMAVHTGARIGALAGTGELLVSRTVRDLSAGSGLIFEDLGMRRLKGLPDDTNVFRVRVN
jgi:class 3 adenylate cyclase/pimeloyl-ACP methyl ester carboxylesterase